MGGSGLESRVVLRHVFGQVDLLWGMCFGGFRGGAGGGWVRCFGMGSGVDNEEGAISLI